MPSREGRAAGRCDTSSIHDLCQVIKLVIFKIVYKACDFPAWCAVRYTPFAKNYRSWRCE
jgi:hypothetical protein